MKKKYFSPKSEHIKDRQKIFEINKIQEQKIKSQKKIFF